MADTTGKRVSELTENDGSNPSALYVPAYNSETGETEKVALGSIVSYDEATYAYGIRIDLTSSASSVERIGNSDLHKSLPIQSGMKGCLLDDDGNVVQYLPTGSWEGATRDGSKGQVMVEIPGHWEKYLTDTANECYEVWISAYNVPGYTYVPTMYVSAYQATVDRTNLQLCSVYNTDEQYRGGNNVSTYDTDDFSFLGVPASQLGLSTFQTYARNRGSAGYEDCGWNAMTFLAWRTIYWLYVIEYANRNVQLTYNSELTSDGYRQGGLGAGVTSLNSNRWSNWNGSRPFVPCGHTDSLGNGSGYVAYTMPFEYDGASSTSGDTTQLYVGEFDEQSSFVEGNYYSDGDSLYECIASVSMTSSLEPTDTTYFGEVTRTVVNVPRYRGIENPFGHIFARVMGAIFTHYPDEYDTDETLAGRSLLSICLDPSKFSTSDGDADGYAYVGDVLRTSEYWATAILGEYGVPIPSSDSGAGGSTTYYADWFIALTSITAKSVCALSVGGHASYGSGAGLAFSIATYAASNAYAACGSRLCFHGAIPSNA